VLTHAALPNLVPTMQDISKRPQGPPTQWPNEIGGYFGIAEFGAFSKVRWREGMARQLHPGAMLPFCRAQL
jgi:hypothetical protein